MKAANELLSLATNKHRLFKKYLWMIFLFYSLQYNISVLLPRQVILTCNVNLMPQFLLFTRITAPFCLTLAKRTLIKMAKEMPVMRMMTMTVLRMTK